MEKPFPIAFAYLSRNRRESILESEYFLQPEHPHTYALFSYVHPKNMASSFGKSIGPILLHLLIDYTIRSADTGKHAYKLK